MENGEKHTLSSEASEFICDICGEQFDTVSELEVHKRRHSRPGRGLEEEEREIRGDIGAAGLPTSPII
jgi:hypothetical protein